MSKQSSKQCINKSGRRDDAIAMTLSLSTLSCLSSHTDRPSVTTTDEDEDEDEDEDRVIDRQSRRKSQSLVYVYVHTQGCQSQTGIHPSVTHVRVIGPCRRRFEDDEKASFCVRLDQTD